MLKLQNLRTDLSRARHNPGGQAVRKEIKLAGFGGQGIVLMGVMLAEAAGYYENMEIAQTQSYGPEARGGACRRPKSRSAGVSTSPVARIMARSMTFSSSRTLPGQG